tara:strand:+ start:1767 stop:4361 length:2595 start_codon:yes stop_codon:yes gene_type:complete
MRKSINFSIRDKLKKKKKPLIILSILGYTAFITSITAFTVKKGYVGNFLIPAANTNFKALTNYAKGKLTPIESISIDIKYKEILKLNKKRNEAVKNQYLIKEESDWVKGIASYKKEKYPLNIRLKGLLPDHWSEVDFWSYKIKLKGDKKIMGMRRFAIEHPRTKGYMNEWYFNQMSNYYGLIAPRFSFSPITINGKRYPIYAIEENFDKYLIENNRKKEGPIFMLVNRRKTRKSYEFYEDISFHQKAYYENYDEGKKLIRRAERLIKGYFSGELKASEVFDLDLMAKAFVLTDLFGWDHALHTHNIRFYMNPLTGLIEPIPFDQEVIYETRIRGLVGERYINLSKDINPIKLKSIPLTFKFISKLFEDSDFSNKYVNKLVEISQEEWLDSFFDSVRKPAQKSLNILHKSYPWYSFDKKKDQLYNNRDFIKSKLNPTSAVKAFIIKKSSEDNSFNARIANTYNLPIEIVAITNTKQDIIHKLKNPHYLANIPLNCVDIADCVDHKKKDLVYSDLNFRLPSYFDLTDLRIITRLIGTNKLINDPLYENSELDSQVIDIRNLDSKSFLIIDNQKRLISIKPGYWELNSKILIPKDYLFEIGPNTTIDLINEAAILSFSPVKLIGKIDSPIVITSSDGSGQGILISGVSNKSIISNVSFVNLNSLKYGGLNYTGSFTAYESNINLDNILFSSNTSEDAINLIRSKVIMRDSVFERISSDALDLDFCEATLSNLSFKEIGNDGLDFSGTNVRADNIYMNTLGDKGISAGEKSNAVLNNVEIINAFIGIASKDSSKINGEEIRISSSEIGIAGYRKKSEYGSGSINLKNTFISDSKTKYLSEKNSNVIIDNKLQPNNINNLYESIYKDIE